MSPSEMGRLIKVIEDTLREVRGEEASTKIAAALLGSYSVVPFAPLGAPPDWDTSLIRSAESEQPYRHYYGCRCGNCAGEFPLIRGRAPRDIVVGAMTKAADLTALYQAGKPMGHSESCRCDKCDTFNRSVRP